MLEAESSDLSCFIDDRPPPPLLMLNKYRHHFQGSEHSEGDEDERSFFFRFCLYDAFFQNGKYWAVFLGGGCLSFWQSLKLTIRLPYVTACRRYACLLCALAVVAYTIHLLPYPGIRSDPDPVATPAHPCHACSRAQEW